MMGSVNGDSADLQSQFSMAYVQAVASTAGYFIQVSDRGLDKDGIDGTVLKRGKFGMTASPRLDLQVKSHQGRAHTDPIRYDLDVKSYNDLRAAGYQVPRILVLVLVPDDVSEWIKHSEEEMALRRCAYWLSLLSAPDTTNISTIRIEIPRAQTFEAKSLKELMRSVAEGRTP
jgi:Domain of unknown function (DUF4365)